MKLPYQNSNSQKGQILIIFLLVLVVGLAIALSIASRSVTDVRQTTTSDESNRAYFAAEAGVEDALKKIEQQSVAVGTPYNVNLKSTNRSEADVIINNLSIDNTLFEYPTKTVEKDDVAQINLMSDFATIGSACTDTCASAKGIKNNDTLDIYWGTETPYPALEVSVVTCSTPVPCTNSGSFHIHKMVFDPANVGITNFCKATGIDPLPTATNITKSSPFPDYRYKISLKLDSNSSPQVCSSNDAVPSSQAPVLARIRPLYSRTGLAVGSPANRLPDQGYVVDSKGLVGSGVARKLLVYQLYPALPSVFDYVLYNGSSTNSLSK